MLSVKERRDKKEAFTEISSKWAGRQAVTGPVLVLPYTETVTGDKGQIAVLKKLAYVLPDNLNIESYVKPEERHRGIFQVMLYSYIFTILQLQDYSLLLGSIGLFLTLAVIMHFSKKIQW